MPGLVAVVGHLALAEATYSQAAAAGSRARVPLADGAVEVEVKEAPSERERMKPTGASLYGQVEAVERRSQLPVIGRGHGQDVATPFLSFPGAK